MSLGPLDLAGASFLTLYLCLLFCVVLISILLPRVMRPAGDRREIADPEELAVLVGGTTRLAEAIVTKLLAKDMLTMPNKGLYALSTNAAGATGAERSVLTGTSPSKWKTIEERLRPHVSTIDCKLVADGLMVGGKQARRLRVAQAGPYFLLLCFGIAKLIVGLLRDRPVGYLIFLLLVTAVATVIRLRTVDRKTGEGHDLIRRARERSSRLRSAPMRSETGLAVALFGTTVLLGSGLATFHQARAADSRDGGSGGDGGSTGCGGGGCGGCGGCGG